MAEVHGSCDDRFSGVREALERHLDADELGASIAVDLDGETVVDLWGGYRDEARTTPWTQDTIVNVWSTTKTRDQPGGADAGRPRPARPLRAGRATTGRSSAANGKDQVEVRHLMSHTSGVSGLGAAVRDRGHVRLGEVDRAGSPPQAPWWEPGTASGYHAQQPGPPGRRGRSGGSAARRSSSSWPRRSPGRSGPTSRSARVESRLGPDRARRPAAAAARSTSPRSTRSPMVKTFTGPAASAEAANTPGWRRADMGALNGHGNARSVRADAAAAVARRRRSTACGCSRSDTIDLIFDEQCHGPDLVLGVAVRFGIGYALPEPRRCPTCPRGGPASGAAGAAR